MNKRLNALIVANVCLLMLPAVTLAQLPTPTYGWNLGNTLEPPCGEGCWGPAATQALINAVADAGFNTVRIPCAWDSHANQTTYVIDPVYMARVKQVVDWCYARNLYVIINCHWDGGWLENHITADVNSTINAKQNAYWTQIANAFANYDDHLLFAGCNEPGADTAAEMATLLVYEQTFVDAVRATGGNNSTRWLLVQGPNTDIDLTYSLMNALPTDSTPGRLMVEVHYYSPWQFCGLTQDQSWGNMFYFWGQDYHSVTLPSRNCTWGEEDYLATEFQKMKTKFVDQEVPVLLGEFSAVKRIGYSDLTGRDLDLHLASRTYFHKEVVDVANSKGLKPCYWDAGGSGTNGAWLFDRSTAAVVDQNNITALTGGVALPPPTNNPPTVSIISPEDGDTFAAGSDITIDVNATDSDGNVTKVEFYQGSTKLGEATSPPYSYTWNNVPTGSYSITAKATDDGGDTTISSAVNIEVIGGTGAVLREWWTGIAGTAVSDLTSSPNYPGKPSGRELITSLEGPTNWADNYGTRIRGYLWPAADGNYTFWIASDANSELWLSIDDKPSHISKIAYVAGDTNSRQWDKYSSQQSSPISLTAGGKYYIEVLQKAADGNDNVAVAWAGPALSQRVIDGLNLSPCCLDMRDFARFAVKWRLTNCNAGNSWCSGADFSRNGSVTLDDLGLFAESWLDGI